MAVPKENHNTFFIDREKNNLLLGNRLKETKEKKKKSLYNSNCFEQCFYSVHRPHDQL